jgi:hypothetical protein
VLPRRLYVLIVIEHGTRRVHLAGMVIDGTLIPIDRVAADRPFYSGKTQEERDEPAVIASPQG